MDKILIMANRDFVLYNFRFELIKCLLNEGNDVVIYLPYGPKVDSMTKEGARFIPLTIDSRGKNPICDLRLIENIKTVFDKELPDLVLLFTTKVCIYGGIVAKNMGIPYMVSVSGLGTAVRNISVIQSITIKMYRQAAQGAKCVFFQNDFSKEFFHKHMIYPINEILTTGSGVNIDKWKCLDYPDEKHGIHFLFAGRIIKEKGVEDYFRCAERIKKEYPDTVFHVAGPCDGKYKQQISNLEKRNIILYHGEIDNIADLLEQVHCLIHPSYYPEGVSNVCLEAAASGRPIITTDNEGCAETVADGVSGYIYKMRDIKMMIDRVYTFIRLPLDEKKEMGMNGRKKISCEYDRRVVTDQYMKEIRICLSGGGE